VVALGRERLGETAYSIVKNSACRTGCIHSLAFKGGVALAVLRDDKTTAEIRKEFELHASLVIEWKRQLLDGAAKVLAGGRQAAALADLTPLHAKIAQLALESDLLKRARTIARLLRGKP
jgi:transposase-like protein